MCFEKQEDKNVQNQEALGEKSVLKSNKKMKGGEGQTVKEKRKRKYFM